MASEIIDAGQDSHGSVVASLLTAPVIALGTLVDLMGCCGAGVPRSYWRRVLIIRHAAGGQPVPATPSVCCGRA
ncbi:MAG: hypothetical protein U5O39_12820 [Gammaproteobacteria bacterium]|nr:hypothetical protein [Gammaproteobacteria bacterium]